MTQYVIRRLLALIPVLFGGSLIIFFSLRLFAPGDIVSTLLADAPGASDPQIRQRLTEEFGLHRPAHVQYLYWLGGAFQGNLGTSWSTGRPAMQEVLTSLPVTLELATISLVLAAVISIPLGVFSAVRRNSWLDYLARLVAIVGLSVPNFVVAVVLLLGISILWGWSPPVTFTPPWVDLSKHLQHMALPVLALTPLLIATPVRLLRSTMLEVLRNDYNRTARAKGVTETDVVYRHALKNALIPVVTIMGTQVSVTLGGAVVIEQIFLLPGVGRLMYESIRQGDFPQLQANVLYLLVVFLIMNLLVDLSYAWLDPRIRYS